jgi:hypothetical protein
VHGGVGLGIGWVGMVTAWQMLRNRKRSEASLFHLPMVQPKKYLKKRTHGKVEEICEGNWCSQGQLWPSEQINCGCSQHSRTGSTCSNAVLFHLPIVQAKKYLKKRTHGKVEEICEGNWSSQEHWWDRKKFYCLVFPALCCWCEVRY